jgi:hypothetical protein
LTGKGILVLTQAVRKEPEPKRSGKTEVKKIFSGRKPDLAEAAHRRKLKNGPFECCIKCPGCTGRVEDGKLGCGNGHGTVVMVTPKQAAECDGSKPNVGTVGRQSLSTKRRI